MSRFDLADSLTRRPWALFRRVICVRRGRYSDIMLACFIIVICPRFGVRPIRWGRLFETLTTSQAWEAPIGGRPRGPRTAWAMPTGQYNRNGEIETVQKLRNRSIWIGLDYLGKPRLCNVDKFALFNPLRARCCWARNAMWTRLDCRFDWWTWAF